MKSFTTYWFLTTIVLSFTSNNLSEAKHEKKLPSAVVVGTVYCDTCFQADFSKASHFISGALVAVECGGGTSSKPSFREEVKTNEHGEFRVHLPFSVSKHVKKIEGCSVKLISSSEPYCAVASTATSSLLRLKSRKQGTHIFSAGFFTFKPLKQPTLCNQKPSVQNSKEFNSQKPLIPFPDDPTFPPPIQDPPMPYLPPIDQNHLPPLPQLPMLPPLPQLPPLPTLPGIPYFPPVAKKAVHSKSADPLKASKLSNGKVGQQQFFQPLPQIPLFPSPSPSPPTPTFGIPLPPNPFQPPSVLPPNPFLPPPAVLPPNPFQTPPSVFPPNPFQPSPPLINIPPPLPVLTPPLPSSSPPPAAFPNPLPPFPFQPSPGFPGIPPASSSSSKKTAP